MSQMEEKINVEQLDQKKIIELLKEAQKNEPEARYILEIPRYNRPSLREVIQILYGDAEVIKIDEDKVAETETDIVIPKTSPTVIVRVSRSDYPEYDGLVDIYIFTHSKGWVRVS